MDEIIMALIMLAIGLVLWAVVGHGIWLAMAAMLTAVFGRRCEQCGRKFLAGGECLHCREHPSESNKTRPAVREDLAGARRLLDYSRYHSWLTSEQHTNLSQLIDRLAARVNTQQRGQTSASSAGAVQASAPAKEAPSDSPQPFSERPSGTTPPTVGPEVIEAELVESQPLSAATASAEFSASPVSAEPPVASEIHPLDRADEPSKTGRAPAPIAQRVKANLLRSFMEQSNIRWVELISAALIVVCSVGLVISLWSTLSSTSRFFPSLVFLLATVAVHAAGQYTLRQWKLRSTSRGILHIGLMLIPLAVLVGILLARRANTPPTLDWTTATVIAIGTLVYGALAITASRSLFSRRWPLAAFVTIVSSLTLIPIHYLGSGGHLGSGSAIWVLMPLVLVSMWSALATSGTCSRPGSVPAGLARRVVGIMTQSLFASLVVFVFWIIQSGRGGFSAWWWVPTCLVAAGWASWGWGTSLPSWRRERGPQSTPERARSRQPGWLTMVAWCTASLCTLALIGAVWQAASTGPALTTLLLLVALWWLVHGWLCNLRASLLFGALALIGAATIAIEMTHADSLVLSTPDWLAFSRIVTLTLLGLVALVVAGTAGRLSEGESRVESSLSGWRGIAYRPRATLNQVRTQFMVAGGVAVSAAALLTVVASLTPVGETPYGGNWAALMLMTYGAIGMCAAIAGARAGENRGAFQFLMPAGQAMLLLGTVTLCQTSPMLDGLLGHLRPARSWSVGTALLALAWSTLAVALRWFRVDSRPKNQSDPRRQASRNPLALPHGTWLSRGAIVLGGLSGLVIWSAGDQLVLASGIGWFLPLTCFALFLSQEQSQWREATIITACLWLGSLLFTVGRAHGWWGELGLAASCGVLVALCLVAILVFEQVVHRLGLRRASSLSGENRREESISNGAIGGVTGAGRAWQTAGPYWASQLVLLASWIVLLLTIAIPAARHMATSLGANWAADTSLFATRAPDRLGFALLICTGVFLTFVCSWLGQIRSQWKLKVSVAYLPIFSAFATAAWVASPLALPAALWVLALWLVGSELLAWWGPSGSRLSESGWRRLFAQDEKTSREDGWLALGRGLALGLLLVGTVAILIVACSDRLPTELSPASAGGWGAGALVLLRFLGPVLVVMLVRWALSVRDATHPAMIAISGSAVAIAGGFTSCLAIPSAPAWPSSGIVLLQVTSLIAAALAWLTMGITTLRNLTALRLAAGGTASLRQLLPKAMQGARQRRMEKASWSLNQFALASVVVLCLGAAAVALAYPLRPLPGIDRLGGPLSALSFGVTTSLFTLLASRRGSTHFGLLAIVLGLAAPLGSAAYASWLLADPSRGSLSAKNFEPFRSLVVLWLAALAVGLVARIRATLKERSLSAWGEFGWILLAVGVGGISLVSITQDPNSIWPLAQLSTLALVTVLSGVFSGQAWRGHVAAVAAAAGLWSGLGVRGGADWLELVWITLWGPAWVSLVSIAARLWWPARWPDVFSYRGSPGDARSNARVVDAKPTSPRLEPGEAPHRNPSALAMTTVDQTVSLHVPVASAILSFLWLVRGNATAVVTAPSVAWILGLSTAVLVLAVMRLWDQRRGKRGLAVYMSLLSLSLVAAAGGCFLYELPPLQSWLMWITSGLGAMAIMAGLLRELVRESSRLGPALRLGTIADDPAHFRHALGWMPAVHTAAAILALVPSVLLVLAFEERSMRIAATMLPFVGAIAILPIATERGKAVYRYSGLFLMSISFALLWWADLPGAWAQADGSDAWIYLQRVFAALVTLGVSYPALAHVLRRNELWVKPLMHLGWALFGLGVACGASMLLGELNQVWGAAAVSASTGDKIITLVAWVAVVARLLQFAAWPQGLDRAASISSRKLAVYAAEIGLASLSAAFYLHYPDLFSGLFVRWWPIIVFAIAMVSAGVGHWLGRVGQSVLGDPVGQSSLLLPLIPLAGVWWFRPEGTDWLWSQWGRYSVLLLTAASLYGLHGWLRESVKLRAFSAGLMLMAFWAFLHSRPNLQFFEHPQFWLLPPALATLVFVEFNRKRLESRVVVATRYLSILTAYFSSTAEILLKAFEGQLWQPLLLLMLALAGVAAGIVMRVRAFLICGAAFTMVALLGMVWHAQQAIGQVWPWWAFGIATGISLIALLGYFEKNRPRVIAYLERFKQWEQ